MPSKKDRNKKNVVDQLIEMSKVKPVESEEQKFAEEFVDEFYNTKGCVYLTMIALMNTMVYLRNLKSCDEEAKEHLSEMHQQLENIKNDHFNEFVDIFERDEDESD